MAGQTPYRFVKVVQFEHPEGLVAFGVYKPTEVTMRAVSTAYGQASLYFYQRRPGAFRIALHLQGDTRAFVFATSQATCQAAQLCPGRWLGPLLVDAAKTDALKPEQSDWLSLAQA